MFRKDSLYFSKVSIASGAALGECFIVSTSESLTPSSHWEMSASMLVSMKRVTMQPNPICVSETCKVVCGISSHMCDTAMYCSDHDVLRSTTLCCV